MKEKSRENFNEKKRKIFAAANISRPTEQNAFLCGVKDAQSFIVLSHK